MLGSCKDLLLLLKVAVETFTGVNMQSEDEWEIWAHLNHT